MYRLIKTQYFNTILLGQSPGNRINNNFLVVFYID